MALRWLASFSCALICCPVLAPAGAQAQTSPAVPVTATVSFPQSATLHDGSLYTILPENAGQPELTAPKLQQAQTQLAFNRELWTADDAIPAPSAQNLNSEITPSSPRVDKSDCRWSFGVSSTWNCKIKPLTKYDFAVPGTLRHLWPVHGKE